MKTLAELWDENGKKPFTAERRGFKAHFRVCGPVTEPRFDGYWIGGLGPDSLAADVAGWAIVSDKGAAPDPCEPEA